MSTSFLIEQWQFAPQQCQRISHADGNQPETIEKNHWYHCQREVPELRKWLLTNGIEPGIVKSLLADDTRPRYETYADGSFVLILRGVNLNQGALPDDMLSLRILWHNGSLITTRKIPSKTVSFIRSELLKGQGPKSIAELIVAIIDGLNNNIAHFLDGVEDRLFEIEEQNSKSDDLHHIHKRMLKLKRFLKPQAYALNDLVDNSPELLRYMRSHCLNTLDMITRINESIDFYLEQIQLINADIMQEQSERMNRNTYLFTVIAALFLPVSFLTGLLGVNVGGIPGVENAMAFTLFCVGLVVCFGLEFVLLRWLKFF